MTVVHAVWSDDHELWIFDAPIVPPAADDHDPEWGRFNVLINDSVWQAFVDAQVASEAAYERLLVASGLAADQPARARACIRFMCDKPDPTQFLGSTLFHRCNNCGHYQRDHAHARERVA